MDTKSETQYVAFSIRDKQDFQLPCGFDLSCVKDIPCPCGNPNHWLIRNDTWKNYKTSALAPCANHNDRPATKAFAYGDPENLRVTYLCDECANLVETTQALPENA